LTKAWDDAGRNSAQSIHSYRQTAKPYDDAWEDYLYWQTQDKKTLRKINTLLKDIDRSPFDGIGKPEPLRFELSGYWSRRIDDFNRIIYRIQDNRIEILQCGAHYRDTGK
jgi:toxin YoeB